MIKRVMNTLLLSATFVAISISVAAQKTTQIHPGNGGSPHVRTEWSLADANIAVEYGRPYLKGRTIGKEIVPFGHIWRFGADEATTLMTDKALRFGNLTVPAGKVTLWIMPSSGEKWQLVINKETGQGGMDYNAEHDMGRVDLKVDKTTAPVEQLTISLDPNPGGGILKAEWGTVRASIPFTIVK